MDAHLLKVRLESEGIWCEVQNENATAYAPTPEGIKLVVLEKDIEKAQRFIDQSAHHLQDKKVKPLQCPHCNSTRYEIGHQWLRKIPILHILVRAMRNILLGNSSIAYRCKDCNCTFSK
jgi:transposase